MKLQATAPTAVCPAALAAASISLALLLLPGAAVRAPSSGVAPALELVAGEVVAAVQAPVHAVTRAHHPKRIAVPSAKQRVIPTSLQHSTSAPKRTVPAHARRAENHRVLRSRAVTRRPVTTNHAPIAQPPPVTRRGNGKAKANAWGHLKKLAPQATPAPAVPGSAPNAGVNGAHGKAHGHSVDAPHGPPAVPPGQAKKASGADEHAAPSGHGGAR